VVGIASNGEEAVSMFISFSEKPKVILMDHRMPIKSGIEAAKEILEMNNNTKIIFTTGDDSIKEKALSIGAFSFRIKPIMLEQLLDDIKKALK